MTGKQSRCCWAVFQDYMHCTRLLLSIVQLDNLRTAELREAPAPFQQDMGCRLILLLRRHLGSGILGRCQKGSTYLLYIQRKQYCWSLAPFQLHTQHTHWRLFRAYWSLDRQNIAHNAMNLQRSTSRRRTQCNQIRRYLPSDIFLLHTVDTYACRLCPLRRVPVVL